MFRLSLIIKQFIFFVIIITPILSQDFEFRKIENNSFKLGEKLTFDVNYGFITAGVAVFHVSKIKKISVRDTYHVLFTVNTTSAFDLFYRVRDRYETYIDVEGLFPWRFEQHIREGGYSRDFSAFFDQRIGKAKTSEGTYDIPLYVNDIVSAFYLVRTYDFSNMKKGDKFYLENFYKDKVYPLHVVYWGKETISVVAGKFECLIVEPLISEGGLYKSDGRLLIWLTNDIQKIPVKVKAEILIGSIDAELTNYEGLTGALKSKK
ncbi:MAG: DUF3108 domain-containing protein [Ignavibacteriales bacterium]|nr:DUF3108 domain-containing protein [Ignavibacteriales bacterium]